MARGEVVVKLDMMKDCLFKLGTATGVSFAFKQGQLFIVNLKFTDAMIARLLGAVYDHDVKRSNIKLLEGDLVQSDARNYQIKKITRCTKEKLVFVEATAFSGAL
jgi:hypothetical protein